MSEVEWRKLVEKTIAQMFYIGSELGVMDLIEDDLERIAKIFREENVDAKD